MAIVLLSGCLGDTTDPTVDGTGASRGAAFETPSEPLRQVFEGHLLVGAAFELPAHFTPTDELVRPIWSTGFVVEITEAPEILEIRVDWTTSGPTDLMLMAHGPHGAERPEEKGWSEYTTHEASEPVFATVGPLCMRIPAADVEQDLVSAAEHGSHPYWYPMVHSHVGADVDLTFTVTSVGGAVAIPDAVHGHDTSAEEFVNIVETGHGPLRAWEPCELDLGDA